MTYATHHGELSRYMDRKGRPERPLGGIASGMLGRVFDALFLSRQRQAEREMARFIVDSGRQLTDDIERRMMQRLTTSGWNSRDQ